MAKIARRFLKDTSGATAVEYGVMVGMIFLAIAGTMFQLGGGVEELYEEIVTKVVNAL